METIEKFRTLTDNFFSDAKKFLEKDNAIEDFRNLIGATDPQKAAPGTIRNLFAKSIDANAIHGSDSDENAQIEGNFFFSAFERP